MKYKVTGEAKYKYEVEAESEVDAIEKAREMFDDEEISWGSSYNSLLAWRAWQAKKIK